MTELQREEPTGPSFTQAGGEARSWLPWAIAGAVILLGIGLLIGLGGRHSTGPSGSRPGIAPEDPYAASLTVGSLRMSESSNFAGGKVTYLDGQIANHGDKTLTGITVQVIFRNDLREVAQRETLPLGLVRTREPYVDLQPVSASPLKPGEQRDFRLIFDSVAPDWNQQYPEIRIVQVAKQQPQR